MREVPVGMVERCEKLCEKYKEVFSPGLGLLKDFELDVKFKPGAEEKFCKPRAVPLIVIDDLNKAYNERINMVFGNQYNSIHMSRR